MKNTKVPFTCPFPKIPLEFCSQLITLPPQKFMDFSITSFHFISIPKTTLPLSPVFLIFHLPYPLHQARAFLVEKNHDG